MIEFGEKASKKVSATRRSIKRLKAKFLSESTKALNETMKTKPSDFPLPKDLKLNFGPETNNSKSSQVKPVADNETFQAEDSIQGYYQQQTKIGSSSSVYRSDVKLPPRNVLVEEPWPQPLLPPLSPQRSGAISLPSRYIKIVY